MASNANDKSFTYTPVRITNPEDIVGGGVAGTVAVSSIAAGDNNIGNVDIVTLPALVAGTAVIGHVIVDSSGLPSGAASAAKQPALGTAGSASADVITVQGRARMTPVQVLLQTSTATLSNVNASGSSVTLLAANAARKGATIVNDSTSVLYVKFGSTASTTSYSYYLPGTNASGVPSTLEVPYRCVDIITGIWATATGAVRVTEYT